MRKFFKKFLKFAFYTSSAFLIIISIALIISQTEGFRNYIRGYVITELENSIGGEVYVGKFYGNIFTGLGVDRFYINVDGKPFVKVLGLEVKYNPIGLIKGTYTFQTATIYKPEIYIIRGKDGRWNFQNVFKPKDRTAGSKFAISFGKLVIDDGKFIFVDSLNQEKNAIAESLDCIDYHNFKVTDINAVISGSYEKDRINLKSLNLSFIIPEKFSGKIKGGLYADKEEVKIENFEILSEGSAVKFNFFAKSFNLFKFNREALENSYMSVRLKSDSVSFAELTKFIPHLHIFSGSPSIEVEAEGNLKNLRVNKIKARVYESDILVSGELKNLLKFSEFFIDAKVVDSKVKISDIGKFITIVKLPRFGVDFVKFDGEYKGHPLDFKTSANLSWGETEVKLDGSFKIGSFIYDLNLKVSGLNPKEILSREDLSGVLNFSGNLKGEGLKFDEMRVRGNLDIANSILNKVLIPRSNLWFEVKSGELNGSFVSFSEGFKGLLDVNIKKQDNDFILSLSGSLSELDISKIRVDEPQFLKSNISGDINVKFRFGEVKAMELFAQLNPSIFGNYEISRLRMNAKYLDNGKSKKLVLQSNMFDANIEGHFSFGDLFKALSATFKTFNDELNEKINFVKISRLPSIGIENPVDVEYKFKLKNLTPISVFSTGQIFQAVGNVYGSLVADSIGLYFNVDANLQKLLYLSYKRTRIDTFKMGTFNGGLYFKYEDEKLGFRINLGVGNFASKTFNLKDMSLKVNYNEPEIYLEISASADIGNVNLIADGEFNSEINRYVLKELTGEIYGNRIDGSDIEIFQTKSGFIFNPSGIDLNGQRVYLAGFVDKKSQQVRLWGEDLKLEGFPGVKSFSGIFDFSVFVYGTHEKPSSEFEILVKDLKYKNAELGKFECFGKFENEVVEVNSSLVADIGGSSYNAMSIDLSFPAWFLPEVRVKYGKPYMTGKVKLFRFPLALVEPLVPMISDLNGDITAEVDIGGTFDRPSFKGSFSLQNCIFKLKLNNKYYLAYGTGRIDSNVVYVEDVSLWNNPDDYSDGEVQITGKVYLDKYSISSGDFNITGKLLVLDKEGLSFGGLYGRVIAETVGDGLKFKVDTTGYYLGGEILLSEVNVNYLAKQSSMGTSRAGFEYVFVTNIDTGVTKEATEEQLVHLNVPLIVKDEEVKGSSRGEAFAKLNYDLKISTAKESKFLLILNTQTGEEFFANFNGSINIRNFSGSSVAYGEINLLDGSYYNFFKRFDAKGKLKFTGDVQNPELDISASYTGTHTVLTDTVNVGRTETVQITLLITGTLNKPNVKFQMLVDGQDYQKVYPHGEVESDAISFLATGRFKDELTRVEMTNFTESLWSSTGASLLSSAVSGVITDVLRDVLGGFITSTEFGYSTGFKGLRITGNIGGATVQFGGDIFTDISKSVVVVQYPLLKKFLGGNLTIEYRRSPVQLFHEKEIVNKLGLYYRIRL
jgi:hypothetical protein